MLSSKIIKKCCVKVNDTTNTRAIFGPYLPHLRGSTRQKLDRVKPEYIGIPRDFYELYKSVTLTADAMFVNVIAFFMITLSRDIRLFTCEYVPSCTANQLSRLLKKIV